MDLGLQFIPVEQIIKEAVESLKSKGFISWLPHAAAGAINTSKAHLAASTCERLGPIYLVPDEAVRTVWWGVSIESWVLLYYGGLLCILGVGWGFYFIMGVTLYKI